MGRDKAWLPFGAERLLQRTVARLLDAVDDVVVVARPGQDLPPLPAAVRVVRDDVPDQGPLGGLAPGLRASRADACFATACDAPFVSAAVVTLLFDRLGSADVAVAEAEGFTHPLCAVYRCSVAEAAAALVAAGRLRPVYLYERVPTVRVPEDALRAVDPDLSALRNLNEPTAYEAALADAFPDVRVELFDLARARAGTGEARVRADTLGGALLALADRLPALVPDVLTADGGLGAHWRVSLDGGRFVEDPSVRLPAGTTLVLLSALAGG